MFNICKNFTAWHICLENILSICMRKEIVIIIIANKKNYFENKLENVLYDI